MAATSCFALIQRKVRNINNMDGFRQKKLITLGLLLVILSVLFFRDLKNIADHRFFKEKYVLIVGILSSPDNFQKRVSIRNTWLKLTTGLSVSYYFVIGDKFCDNHPLDRTSNYTCEENSMSLPENGSVNDIFTIKKVIEKKIKNPPKMRCFGFGFQTLHDIIIKELGVLTSFMDYYDDDVTIKVISSDTKAVLASVTVPYNHGTADDLDFILVPVNNILMKKASEAQVLMEPIHKNTSYLASCENFEWNFTPGVINYLHLFQAGFRKPWPFKKNSCSYVLMTYEIADYDSFKRHLTEKGQRRKEWEKYKQNLYIKLENESKQFGDIAYVDVIDVYQNLPKKLIKFFTRIVDTEQFDFVLKTDDDTFIDIMRVFKKVAGTNDINGISNCGDSCEMDFNAATPHFWWWSNFREYWKVQESGKWREDKYRSPAYPSFPCGGGYVLSRGLVCYLTENRKNLQYFQGEDVSIGIWLSGLRTVQYTSSSMNEGNNDCIQENILKRYGGEGDWLKFKNSNQNKLVRDICDWTCDRETYYNIPLCNKVQLSVSEMYEIWDDYVHYGFIQ